MHEARYYSRKGHVVLCELCPQGCQLTDEQEGICGARRVEDGKLVTLNYGLCCSLSVDPIEKKPLYHFYPGWEILSMGTSGCNLNCSFCQNWTLARGEKKQELEEITGDDLLKILKTRPEREQLGIAYTYNEPTVWYEYVRDTSQIMWENGYKNVLVSNGLINKEPLQELLPFIDAINIDVKAFSDSFYKRHCKGTGLGDVLDTVEQCLPNCHVEITYLIITSLNDSPQEIGSFIDWVASLNKEIPVHFSRYFPSYRMDLPPTPLQTMQNAWQMAREKLSYVYLGNVMDQERSATYCPKCSNLLITRKGYRIKNEGLDRNFCQNCGNTIKLTGHIYGEES